MKRFLYSVIAWIGAILVLILAMTTRLRVQNDSRPKLRAEKQAYIYAGLHAHQPSAVCINDETKLMSMVSRSTDGDLIVPSLRLRRVHVARGSTRKGGVDKGGRAALQELAKALEKQIPVSLAVDGPRGPRNHVHKGCAQLAIQTGAVIIPAVTIPKRRWILSRTWDRMQIPKPFTTINNAGNS